MEVLRFYWLILGVSHTHSSHIFSMPQQQCSDRAPTSAHHRTALPAQSCQYVWVAIVGTGIAIIGRSYVLEICITKYNEL